MTGKLAAAAAFLAALRAGPVLLDGAMGTMLASTAAVPPAIEILVPEELNERAPERVRAVHRAYAAAGAQVLETNSFGGNAIKLAAAGLSDRVYDLNARAARLAREAADEPAGAVSRPVWVAGSIGPTGGFIEPLGDLAFETVRAAFAEQAAALAEGGADLVLVETMTDLEEARAAVLGALDGAPLPVAVTLTFESHGRTMMGVTPEQAVAALADAGAAAVGVNCGDGPATVLPIVARMAAARPGFPLVAQPNAGRPRLDGDTVRYDVGPEGFAAHVPEFIAAGVRLLGSCCGSTPAHTAALAAALATVRAGGR